MLVSLSTTGGWRRADAELASALRDLGLSVVQVVGDFGRADRVRRLLVYRLGLRGLWWPISDLGKAATMRFALGRALRDHHPRAIVYSTVTSTLLQPRRRLRGATAVWFDTPHAMNRRGRRNFVQPRLERRSLRQVAMLLPLGAQPDPEVLSVVPDRPAVALPVPVYPAVEEPSGDPAIAMTYAPALEKKGLDIAARAWGIAAPKAARLVVSGVDAAAGRAFLARSGVEEPTGIEWAGPLSAEDHLRLRSRAGVFVSGSRYEDYGIAQLEALADGALLVTVPSGGPFPALSLARELAPRLVARSLAAEDLAAALRAAFDMSAQERERYRAHARELIRSFSATTLRERLEREVLPMLLSSGAARRGVGA